jgi:hypothetical protein
MTARIRSHGVAGRPPVGEYRRKKLRQGMILGEELGEVQGDEAQLGNVGLSVSRHAQQCHTTMPPLNGFSTLSPPPARSPPRGAARWREAAGIGSLPKSPNAR